MNENFTQQSLDFYKQDQTRTQPGPKTGPDQDQDETEPGLNKSQRNKD